MRKLMTLAVVAGFVCTGVFQSADAKRWTVYERQCALNKRVDKAERAKELTFKEAVGLRDTLADIEEDKQKAMNKNNGKLSYSDEDKLEKRLNKVSADIHKRKLSKRIASK